VFGCEGCGSYSWAFVAGEGQGYDRETVGGYWFGLKNRIIFGDTNRVIRIDINNYVRK